MPLIFSSDVLLNDSLDPVVADVCLPCMLVEDPSDHLALYRPRKTRKDNENLDTFSLGTVRHYFVLCCNNSTNFFFTFFLNLVTNFFLFCSL